jgi:ABC-type sugar transport system, periplasmic component
MKLKFFLLFLIALTLFSCNTKGKSDITDNAFTNVCKAETYEIPAGFDPDAFAEIIVDGENIYLQGYTATGPAMYKYDINGQNPVMADTAFKTGGTQYNISDTETIIVDQLFGDTYREKIIITKYNNDEVAFTVDVDNIFDMVIKDVPISIAGDNYFNVESIVTLNGQYYIAGGKKIAVLDPDGNRIALINVSGGDVRKLITYGEDILCMALNWQSGVYTISYIDKINNKIGEKLPLPTGLLTGNSFILLGDGYDFYIKNDVGLYGCNIGSEPIQVANWINSDLLGADLRMLAILSPTEFLYTSYDFNGVSVNYGFGKLTLVPADEYVEKTILRLVKLHNVFDLDRLVINFNKSNDKYRIVIEDYTLYEEDIRVTKLNAAIAGGNIPDIFVYSAGDFNNFEGKYPLDSYVKQGLFMDLLEMFDRDDEISSDVLHDIVLKSFTTDNKLFMLPTNLRTNIFIGKKSNFSFSTWTPLEMIAYSEALPEDQMLISSMVFSTWNDGILGHYVDYENKVVTFDDDFKKLIKYRIDTRFAPNNTRSFERDEMIQLYRSDKMLLGDYYIGGFEAIVDYRNRFGEELTYVGHPAMTGNGSTITSTNYFSISAQSKNLDGAWEFIKFYLLQDLPDLNNFTVINMSFPVTKKHLEIYTDYYANSTFVFWDNGGSHTYHNPLTDEEKEMLENDGRKYEAFTLSREELDGFLNIMATLPPDYTVDETISDIFWEEIQAVEENSPDEVYDKVIGIMKNRMELYLNEKY